eukprot:COSAG01_NODE_56747_length_316_cov_1.096774_1_plen_58_part_10
MQVEVTLSEVRSVIRLREAHAAEGSTMGLSPSPLSPSPLSSSSSPPPPPPLLAPRISP